MPTCEVMWDLRGQTSLHAIEQTDAVHKPVPRRPRLERAPQLRPHVRDAPGHDHEALAPPRLERGIREHGVDDARAERRRIRV